MTTALVVSILLTLVALGALVGLAFLVIRTFDVKKTVKSKAISAVDLVAEKAKRNLD